MEKNILIVDDDEVHRKTLKKILGKMGYHITVAESSEDALKLVLEKDFPLIITDLSMPGMDGVQLCRQIKEKRPESFVYALSGYIKEYQPEKLEGAGFDGHLCKPVSNKVLCQAIEGAFEKITKR
jgi:CheY-like chemotaxis protein